ncbi:hypothetical protein GCM10009827_114550 [Dactylosporangium maewongense]|uniref:Uncharacterized protein n=1 Tax=Dactylosporangium maewongense TaxID=634393 RepID=A0ABN2DCZ5_9ACTN
MLKGFVVPYRAYMQKRGRTVFGDPPPTKTCPSCRMEDAPGGRGPLPALHHGPRRSLNFVGLA